MVVWVLVCARNIRLSPSKAEPLNGEVSLLEGHVDYKSVILVLMKQQFYSHVQRLGFF